MEVFKYNGKQRQTYIFSAYTVFPFLSGRHNDIVSFSSYTTNDIEKKPGFDYMYSMCTSWNSNNNYNYDNNYNRIWLVPLLHHTSG